MLCSESDIINMLSTLLKDEIYLGFADSQPLSQRNHELTFFGGTPIFLAPPAAALLHCDSCINQKLTFICQIFCPLEADHSYHRVLYVLYCEKCCRVFRCLKQQAPRQPEPNPVEGEVRVVSEKSYQIDSEGFDVKDLGKIMKRAHMEAQEEAIEEEEDEDEEEGEEEEMDLKEFEGEALQEGVSLEGTLKAELSKEELEEVRMAAEANRRGEKEEKDWVFEEYKKIMAQLDGPVLLYSNIPIPYNSQPLNPRHFCPHCNSKLTLELQLTEKILSMAPKLLNMDWGSLLVYTCSDSCLASLEECVVVQYEADAIRDTEVSALRKLQKNKKRKDHSKKKEKKRSLSKKEEKRSSKGKEKVESPAKEESGGDWD